MQTRKRRLGSKIDREIGTELLDAKIKYSQNKILSRCIQKLVSCLAKHSKKRSDPLSNYYGEFSVKRKRLKIIATYFWFSIFDRTCICIY